MYPDRISCHAIRSIHIPEDSKIYEGKRFSHYFSGRKTRSLMQKAQEYLANQSAEELFQNYGTQEVVN